MTAIEFYRLLPDEPKNKLMKIVDSLCNVNYSKYRKKFFENTYRSGAEAIGCFAWSDTREGHEYWRNMSENYDNLMLIEEKKNYTKWEGDL